MAVDHYENFPVASLLLPRPLRRAVIDIYRFARSADDIADEGSFTDYERLQQLAAYRHALDQLETLAISVKSEKPPIFHSADHLSAPSLFDAHTIPVELVSIFEPLATTIWRHQLPFAPFYDLLSAFEQDVQIKRYTDYASVLNYCALSANPVGVLMLHLYHAANLEYQALSHAICTGLQLTNFLQDIAIDYQKDRIYLPQEDLNRFNINQTHIAQGLITPDWQALMQFQITRVRSLLHYGSPLARYLPGRIGFELRLIVQGGLRILERIEQVNGDVFKYRPTLGAKDWMVIFWRALRSHGC